MPEAPQRRRLEGDTVQLAPQFRDFTVDRAKVDIDKRTVELTFSSELPYERWWGTEVLDHSPDSIDLTRLSNGGALLMDHDTRDQVGVIERAWVDNKVGRAIVRFSRSARGEEILRDVQDGIRSLVSVGYQIDEMRLETVVDDHETYRISRWTPFEVSLVAVPADPSVGVGREQDQHGPQYAVRVHRPAGSTEQSPANPATTTGVTPMTTVTENAPAGAAADPHALSPDTQRKLEQSRCAALSCLAEQNAIPAGVVRGWIESGKTVDMAAEDTLKLLEKRAKDGDLQGKLDMPAKDVKNYSLLRAIHAVVERNWDQAGLEKEAHDTMQQKLGRMPKSANAFFVPMDVQTRQLANNDDIMRRVNERVARVTGRRDLTVGTASAGGYLVSTQNMGFIDLLRNTTVLYAMGARRMGGLTDSITIPRQTSGATAYWLSTEATQITESQMVLGQIAMTPKTVGAYTEISRQLALQSSPDAEALVMADLAAQVGVDIDAKGISGSGSSGQPTGITNVSGVGSVSGTSLAYAGVIEFMTDVFGANVPLANAGYVTTGAVAGLLKARVKFSSTASPVWDGRLESASVDGYPAMASNNMPAATMIFGDFSQVIIAEWGVLEVDVNPYANFQAGIIGVRAIASIDIAVRYPGAFSIASSIT